MCVAVDVYAAARNSGGGGRGHEDGRQWAVAVTWRCRGPGLLGTRNAHIRTATEASSLPEGAEHSTGRDERAASRVSCDDKNEERQ